MIHLLFLPLPLLCFGFSLAFSQKSTNGVSVPLVRSNSGKRTPEETAAWARRQGEFLVARYGSSKSSSTSDIVSRGSGAYIFVLDLYLDLNSVVIA
jgi:hypothetical protein